MTKPADKSVKDERPATAPCFVCERPVKSGESCAHCGFQSNQETNA